MARYFDAEGNPRLTGVYIPSNRQEWQDEYAAYCTIYRHAEDCENWALADYIGDVLADFEMYRPEV